MGKKDLGDPEGGWPSDDSRLVSIGSSLCYGSQLARFRFWCTALLITILVLYLPYSVMRFTVRMNNKQPGYLNMLYAPGSKCNNINVFMGNTANRSMPTPVRPHSHIKCRSEFYPRGDKVRRWPVPDEKVPWAIPFPDYNPTIFTSESVAGKPVWADPDIIKEKVNPPPQWNTVDGTVDRRSQMGNYDVVEDVPRNPIGRTGVAHRGTLGRWGPNHAADPIVTRWKMDVNGSKLIHSKTQRPILQFIAIKRRDSGIWALPGGMVDPGEKVNVTLRREFSEEAMNSLQSSPEEKKMIEQRIENLFSKGEEIYRGYVDDPRNTDNSWMETIAFNFHDDSGNSVAHFKLHAGDDAVGVKWTDMDRSLNLFASHTDFVARVAQKHNAHW